MAKKKRPKKPKRNSSATHQAQEERPARIALISLGCAKNRVDAETALGNLAENGFTLTPSPEDADVILVNTCGFIESARAESLDVLHEMIGLKDETGFPLVVAMGCFSQREGDTLHTLCKGLDGVWGLDAAAKISEHVSDLLQSAMSAPENETAPAVSACGLRGHDNTPVQEDELAPRLLTTPESYAYLRVADGCNNRCSYCAIPIIRGPMKSRPASRILEEAQILADGGARELVLVAQDTANYGRDRNEGYDLVRLLEELLKVTGDCWIRVLYAHPAHLSDEAISLIGSEPRLCHYIDLPIQHINTRLLQEMNRHVDRKRIEHVIRQIKSAKNPITLRTSLITGFPGETEDEFEELLAFVKEGHFHHLGVFGYSPEKDTPAASLSGHLAPEIIDSRVEKLMQAQQDIAFSWLHSRIGQTTEILIDEALDDTTWIARSRCEAPEVDGIIFIQGTNFYAGQSFHACLTEQVGYDMKANPL